MKESNDKKAKEAVELSRIDMISNTYEDSEVRKVITKKDLNKMVWRSLLLQASFNYERMQGGGWTYGLIPGLKKIHTNKKDLSSALLDHLQLFNTHPFLVNIIQSIVLAMEENKENRDTIRGVKIGMMGPLGGIGDSMFWLTLLPITAGIGAALSASGNIMGPIFFLLVFNAVHFGLRFFLMHYGYKFGTQAIVSLKESTQKISRAASIVGLMVVGALIASYVGLNMNIEFMAGGIPVNVQSILDAIMPKLLPLLYTLFCFWVLKKGKSPLWLILITLILGLAISLLQTAFPVAPEATSVVVNSIISWF